MYQFRYRVTLKFYGLTHTPRKGDTMVEAMVAAFEIWPYL